MPRRARMVVPGAPHHNTQRNTLRVTLDPPSRPFGSDSFLSKPEHALGRRVRALPHGRPITDNGGCSCFLSLFSVK